MCVVLTVVSSSLLYCVIIICSLWFVSVIMSWVSTFWTRMSIVIVNFWCWDVVVCFAVDDVVVFCLTQVLLCCGHRNFCCVVSPYFCVMFAVLLTPTKSAHCTTLYTVLPPAGGRPLRNPQTQRTAVTVTDKLILCTFCPSRPSN